MKPEDANAEFLEAVYDAINHCWRYETNFNPVSTRRVGEVVVEDGRSVKSMLQFYDELNKHREVFSFVDGCTKINYIDTKFLGEVRACQYVRQMT